MHSSAHDTEHGSHTGFILVLPLLFLLSGTLIRFLAFRYQFPDAPPSDYFDQLCRWDC